MPEGDPEEFDQDIEFDPEEQPTVETDAGKAYTSYMKIYLTLILLAIAILLLH